MSRAPIRLGALGSAVLLALAPAAAETGVVAAPETCRAVEAGAALQPVLDAAAEGSTLCLAPGDYAGPIRIRRRITLSGPRSARIRSTGVGTTISLETAGSRLLGVTVDGSGGRFDLLDAAVALRADEVEVRGVAVRDALFGLLAQQARRVSIVDNEIEGVPGKALGLRGDGIRLWEIHDSRVAGNRVRDSRDLVVWYSSGNLIEDNHISGGRYGTHFMYSHDNTVLRNRFIENVVGIFAMYSNDLRIEGNVLARSRGAAGVGLGAKESGNLTVRDNWFLDDTVGAYLETSPLQLDDQNVFERNAFRFCDTAVVFHGTVDRNRFAGNSLRDNGSQVRVEGRGDAQAADWSGNDYDDYAGYDLDRDGIGDVPYALRSLSGEWIARHPVLAFFRGSPALALVELIGRAVPLFQPRTLLVDAEPRMALDLAGAPGEG